ncbi:transketolase [Candidatus Magnetomonas plexicatena]|uniref:transketolase n=1 Tax=Candidatus Magnetomonas plexicatena TaxID=2552947 RepID=UPI001C7793CD|nr:transketolase [Nitrospirales bacterium LBB_01]
MLKACRDIREHILRVSYGSNNGHIPSCFSIVETLYALYEFMNHRPKEPQWEARDIFILSKGHGSLGYYCVLAEFGYFDKEDVYSFGRYKATFGCHADRLKIPGVEASTGSLGHGIGLAVGMALAIKIKKEDRAVYTLIGDGESNEGSVWEAVLVAKSLNLNNLTIIYDNNMSHERGLQIHNPHKHFEGFGCDTYRCNGHDVNELKKLFAIKSDTVKVIVADTVKGCGCKTFTDNHYAWHRRSPKEQELEQLLKELHESAV